jgi:thiol-disulfide isomerase/thioredoxin
MGLHSEADMLAVTLRAALAIVALAGSPSAAPAALEVGAAAPEFVVTPMSGSAFPFAEATKTHAAVVIVFLSVVCPYSQYFEDHLRQLDATYGPKGVMFVGVNSNRTETPEEVVEHAHKTGQTFPIMKDVGNHVADLLGAHVTPEALLFDREGRLRYRGRIRSKLGSTDLRDALDAVLAGRRVKTPVAKAFGCSITRE